MAASVVISACARRNPASHIQIPSKNSKWTSNCSGDDFNEDCSFRTRSDDSSSPDLGTYEYTCRNPGIFRQSSLPVGTSDFGRKSPSGEPKGILKRSRFTSDNSASLDDVLPDSDSSMDVEFLSAFRSVDDLFAGTSDEFPSFRKRVSFSEKIMQQHYRPGSCILQSKLKAQKKRARRNGKDGRRTASESDAGDVNFLTNDLENLSCSRYNDSDSGLETEGSPTLEEVKEADEEHWKDPDPENVRRKKRNRKGKKNKSGEKAILNDGN